MRFVSPGTGNHVVTWGAFPAAALGSHPLSLFLIFRLSSSVLPPISMKRKIGENGNSPEIRFVRR
jgi:hypothetical protein